uniref:Protein containing YqaJ domain n=1 Tax=Rhipicephalus zambeziensis TaxID=60191 RepID=A0A224Z122_9ACAR
MGDASLSAYAQSLDEAAKRRYLDKLELCGGVDPLLLGTDELCFDVDLVPRVEISDIKDYLVHATSYITHEQMKAKKSLEAHLTSGFVQEPLFKKVIVRGKVNHSQALSAQPLEPWIIIKEDGMVKAAHCTCMAGLGEACSHIGAVLFYLEATASLRDSQACTDKKNQWLPPYMTNVPCAPICEIDFSSSSAKRQRLSEAGKPSAKKTKTHVEGLSKEDWNSFLASVKNTGAQSAVLSLSKGFCNDFIPLSQKYSTAVLGDLTRDIPSTWEDVKKECQMFAQAFTVEPQACQAVERATKEQADSSVWFAFRAGRITSSTVYAACRTPLLKPSVSLIKRMCYPEEHKFFSAATNWGKQKEDVARKAYISMVAAKHEEFVCESAGLHICATEPFLAASPDGLISCKCCGAGVLEVKCPYSANCVGDVVMQKGGCLEQFADSARLKRSHAYFHQVQLQLYVCERQYCDFVLWTPSDIFMERVTIDMSFCREMTQKSKDFFEQALLPQLLFRHWTTTPTQDAMPPTDGESSGDEQYCYCGGAEYGEMVQRSTVSGEMVSFHLCKSETCTEGQGMVLQRLQT